MGTNGRGLAWFLFTLVAALVVAAGAFAGDAPEGTTGLLDGMTFDGQTGEQGKEEGDADVFAFAEGSFHSLSCDPYGFGPASYQARKTEAGISFTAVTRSEKEGRMTWKGTVADGSLEGTTLWEKPGQDPLTYWFEGELAE